MSVTATSRVATERGERYRKQLASDFGNKIDVVEEPAGTWNASARRTAWSLPGSDFLRYRLEHFTPRPLPCA